MDKKTVATNRKAFHDYSIIERFEAGIVLAGYEVKSLRSGQSSLADSFVRFSLNEAFADNIYIPPYKQQSSHVTDYEPRHSRKLLLHSNEIRRIAARVNEKGYTLVPLELYFNPRGFAKVSIGVAKGRTAYDKREKLRKKDAERELRTQRG